ncbi:transcription antitermination protein nusG [Pseudarcicella hirudinis]|uniref:Transcription termination/antitermination protein NusG n=1 Tax=Pseudarcicella hirudinis TaxID=1079859 RepID=A0A1I5WKY7_9BACT|nr:transcription termination/antitermination protein NusG [Pseudarcicella hirudinis]SFQ20228.1 transcription antitermination protein nusG [Pseudarcicella hirudinis]
MAETNWYVLRAVSGQEKKIKTYLENEVARQGLQDFVPQILLPSEKIYEMRNGKKVVREKSLFPGYIFVEADIKYGEVSHIITSMPGVIGFLSWNDGKTSKTPIPLRSSEVKRILGKLDEVATIEEVAVVAFSKGETIKVVDGPFSGFEGTIEEIFDDKKKLNVMVKIFGRNTPVELNYSQVEK